MKHFKSERLKKLEVELNDLEQWLKLGLVPKRDIPKHKEEIEAINTKIEDEKERIHFLRESGEAEEYVAPKKQQTRGGYTEMPSIPDIDQAETAVGTSYQDSEFNGGTENGNDTTLSGEKEDDDNSLTEDEDESYFSEKNRWKRGANIIDPDANEW